MQQLFNELNAPIIEINDKGEQVQKAPTSIMLRAARALQQLSTINDTNNVLIQQLQKELAEALEKISTLEKEVYQLKAQQRNLYSQLLEKDSNDSLHEAGQPISELGSSGIDKSGSDRTSEGGIQAEGLSPSTD